MQHNIFIAVDRIGGVHYRLGAASFADSLQFDVDLCVAAVEGLQESPHHCGLALHQIDAALPVLQPLGHLQPHQSRRRHQRGGRHRGAVGAGDRPVLGPHPDRVDRPVRQIAQRHAPRGHSPTIHRMNVADSSSRSCVRAVRVIDLPASGGRPGGGPLPAHRQRPQPRSHRHIARRSRRRRRNRRQAVPVGVAGGLAMRRPPGAINLSAAKRAIIRLTRTAQILIKGVRRRPMLTAPRSPPREPIRTRPTRHSVAAMPVVAFLAVPVGDRAARGSLPAHTTDPVSGARRPRRINLTGCPQTCQQHPQHQPPPQTRRSAPAHTAAARPDDPHASGPPTASGIFESRI